MLSWRMLADMKRVMCVALCLLMLAGCALTKEDLAETWQDILNENKNTVTESPGTPAPALEADGETALAGAELYRERFTYTGDKMLPDETVDAFVTCLEEKGYTVTDESHRNALRNAQPVKDWFQTTVRGELSFWEVCRDGGLIYSCIAADGTSIRHTRVSWRAAGPVVTYQISYPLTALTLADDTLCYTCGIPNNHGTDHDGYVDPSTEIRLGE